MNLSSCEVFLSSYNFDQKFLSNIFLTPTIEEGVGQNSKKLFQFSRHFGLPGTYFIFNQAYKCFVCIYSLNFQFWYVSVLSRGGGWGIKNKDNLSAAELELELSLAIINMENMYMIGKVVDKSVFFQSCWDGGSMRWGTYRRMQWCKNNELQ